LVKAKGKYTCLEERERYHIRERCSHTHDFINNETKISATEAINVLISTELYNDTYTKLTSWDIIKTCETKEIIISYFIFVISKVGVTIKTTFSYAISTRNLDGVMKRLWVASLLKETIKVVDFCLSFSFYHFNLPDLFIFFFSLARKSVNRSFYVYRTNHINSIMLFVHLFPSLKV
jgi:hypothetical protein